MYSLIKQLFTITNTLIQKYSDGLRQNAQSRYAFYVILSLSFKFPRASSFLMTNLHPACEVTTVRRKVKAKVA